MVFRNLQQKTGQGRIKYFVHLKDFLLLVNCSKAGRGYKHFALLLGRDPVLSCP